MAVTGLRNLHPDSSCCSTFSAIKHLVSVTQNNWFLLTLREVPSIQEG